jgi:hypothetical protein
VTYLPFFTPSGTRCLRRGPSGPIIAQDLRTEADLEQAIEDDKALLALLRYAHLPTDFYGGPWEQWKHHRAFVATHFPHVSKATRYRIVRRALGRLRDMKDARQLSFVDDGPQS